jgi:hypothetical protein
VFNRPSSSACKAWLGQNKEKTMNEKTLGQIAYDAYCGKSNWKSLVSGADLPQFTDAPEEVRAAWETAAEAVKVELIGTDEQKAAA